VDVFRSAQAAEAKHEKEERGEHREPRRARANVVAERAARHHPAEVAGEGEEQQRPDELLHSATFRFSHTPTAVIMASGRMIRYATARGRNTPRNISVLLMSTIGPKVRKASTEAAVKVPLKASATKESTVEHTLST